MGKRKKSSFRDKILAHTFQSNIKKNKSNLAFKNSPSHPINSTKSGKQKTVMFALALFFFCHSPFRVRVPLYRTRERVKPPWDLPTFFSGGRKKGKGKGGNYKKFFCSTCFCSVVLPFSRPSYSSLAHRGSPLISKKKIVLAMAHRVGGERERKEMDLYLLWRFFVWENACPVSSLSSFLSPPRLV